MNAKELPFLIDFNDSGKSGKRSGRMAKQMARVTERVARKVKK